MDISEINKQIDKQVLNNKIRLNALSMNGVQSHMNIPWNMAFPTKYTNFDWIIITSFQFGSELVNKNINDINNNIIDNNINNDNPLICARCNQIMDPYGNHAVMCKHGPHAIRRHDELCNYVGKLAIRAGYEVQFEQRYHNIDGTEVRKLQRPGDFVIEDYQESDASPKEKIYFDITVRNNFASSYVKNCSKHIGWLAKEAEKIKSNNYGNRHDIRGIGIEIMGGMGPNGKRLFRSIAERLAMRSNIHESVVLNQIRSKFISILWKNNARMIYLL